MKTKTIQKIIVAFIIVVALLVLNIIFLINTNKAVGGIGELKKEVYKESILIRDTSETRRKREELNVIEQDLNSILIQESEVVPFIGFVENLSNQNNLEININRVDFNKPEENEIGSLEMAFEIRGSWQQVTNFIREIENTDYLINTESVRLSAFGQDGGVGWSANLELRGFTR